ncbi:MAG: hypothetical protein LW837_08435 [Roseomonas sp.]|nr:hypothetical protein [Roseomonas sp.]
MPYQMLMKEMVHAYRLADAAQFPGRCDPEDKGKIVEQKFKKCSGIQVPEGNQTPGIHFKENDWPIVPQGGFGTSQNINLKPFRINLDKVNLARPRSL